jgi:hypothetical protein
LAAPQLQSLPIGAPAAYFGFKAVNDKLYFDAYDSISQTQALYWIDTTKDVAINRVAGDYDLTDGEAYADSVKEFQIIDSLLFFDAVNSGASSVDRSIRWIDTSIDNPEVQTLDLGSETNTEAAVFASYESNIYYIARDSQFGKELRWVDMNDPLRTQHIVDVSYGPESTFTTEIPRAWTVVDGKLYLMGRKGEIGYELLALNIVHASDGPLATSDHYRVPINYYQQSSDSTGAITLDSQDDGVLANDTAIPLGMTAVLVTPPTDGTLMFNSDGTFQYRPAKNAAAGQKVTFTYRVTDVTGMSSVATATLEIVGAIASPLHNSNTPTDVSQGTNPGTTSALDVLALVNFLNSHRGRLSIPVEEIPQASPPSFYYDVNNDFVVSALDVLSIINFINARIRSGQGEGEANQPSSRAADLALLSSDLIDAAIVDLTELDKRKARHDR